MSPEQVARGSDPVAFIRPLIDGWEQGDFAPRPGLLAADLVLTGFTGAGVDRAQGADEIAAYLRDFFSQWRDYRMSTRRVGRLDDEHVLIEGRQHGEGRVSGMHIDETLFVIIQVRDGKVAEIHWHARRDVAFAAAGIDDPGAA
jgi:ketosteroid isomerase-like protein